MQLSSERSHRSTLPSASPSTDVNVAAWMPVAWNPSLAHELCPGQQGVTCSGSRTLGQRLLCLNAAAQQPCTATLLPPPPPPPPPQTPPDSPCGFVHWAMRHLCHPQILTFICSKSFALTAHSKKISRSKTTDNVFIRCHRCLPRLKLKSSGREPKSACQSSRLLRC